MNKDQIKGRAKEAEGKLRQAGGDLTDNASEQAKGAGKEAEGKIQKTFGDAKEKLKGDDK